jgi:hypothetical protein
MTSTLELAKTVIIVCSMIANNNYSRPTVNVDKIISCNNMYNEPLVINKKRESNNNNQNTENSNVYIINNSDVDIND